MRDSIAWACLLGILVTSSALAQEVLKLIASDDATLARQISSNPLVETLDLTGCSIVGAQSFRAIWALKRLKRLNLHLRNDPPAIVFKGVASSPLQVLMTQHLGREVDKAIGYLAASPSLRSLTLVQVTLTGQAFRTLGRMRDLKALSVHGPNLGIHDADMIAFSKAARTGRLESLAGVFPSLTDKGLASLSRMSGLRRLQIVAPKAGSDGAAALASLSNLTTLFLTAPYDGAALEAMCSGMKSLQAICLAHARLQPSDLAHLRSAERLHDVLIGAKQAASMDFLKAVAALRWVDEGRQRGVEKLGLFAEERIAPAALRPFVSVPGLKLVRVWGGGLPASGLADLGRMKHLESVYLSWCTGVTAELIHQFAKRDRLRELSLISSLPLLPDPAVLKAVGTIPSLRKLYIRPIASESLAHLRSMKQLRELTIAGGEIRKEDLGALRKALPDCRVIVE